MIKINNLLSIIFIVVLAAASIFFDKIWDKFFTFITYGSKIKTTDTIQWFCTSYAILTAFNEQDYHSFPSEKINNSSKSNQIIALRNYWGINNAKDAENTLSDLLSGGHRGLYLELMKILDEYNFNDLQYDEKIPLLMKCKEVLSNEPIDWSISLTETEYDTYVRAYDNYKRYGEHAFDGWDYSRAMNLCMWYYVAGYFNKTKALDTSLEIAEKIRQIFPSWDDFMRSYLNGYDLWSTGNGSEREKIYCELKSKADNPFAIDYNINFEKTW